MEKKGCLFRTSTAPSKGWQMGGIRKRSPSVCPCGIPTPSWAGVSSKAALGCGLTCSWGSFPPLHPPPALQCSVEKDSFCLTAFQVLESRRYGVFCNSLSPASTCPHLHSSVSFFFFWFSAAAHPPCLSPHLSVGFRQRYSKHCSSVWSGHVKEHNKSFRLDSRFVVEYAGLPAGRGWCPVSLVHCELAVNHKGSDCHVDIT